MKIFLTIVIFYLSLTFAQSIETKIVHRIQNEIITNIDIKNQFKYLVALNNGLKDLNKDRIFKISNESIIREKIKIIELSKNFKEIKINKDYLDGLLKDIYSRLGLKSTNQFTLYLKNYDLTLNEVEEKLTIDALWNQLIFQKYNSQITIDEKKIKNQIKNDSKQKIKEYRLSEIIFEIKNKSEIKDKYQEVINSVNKIGFKNSASVYSFSDSSRIGGDIGWIKENLLNQNIRKKINDLNIGEISQPIILPNGIMILKVDNTRVSEIEINYEMELQKIIIYEKNRQLAQYSKIYFNKIKKNLIFDE